MSKFKGRESMNFSPKWFWKSRVSSCLVKGYQMSHKELWLFSGETDPWWLSTSFCTFPESLRYLQCPLHVNIPLIWAPKIDFHQFTLKGTTLSIHDFMVCSSHQHLLSAVVCCMLEVQKGTNWKLSLFSWSSCSNRCGVLVRFFFFWYLIYIFPLKTTQNINNSSWQHYRATS